MRYKILIFLSLSVLYPQYVSAKNIPALVWTQVVSPNVSGAYYGLAVYDINNDNTLDIITSRYNKGIEIWLNIKNNWRIQNTSLPDKGFYKQIVLDDINSDNMIDIIGVMYGGGIAIWQNKGRNKWKLIRNGLPDKGKYFDIKVVDLNKDGIKDIVVASAKGIEIWMQNKKGNRWIRYKGNGLPVYEYYHTVEVVDINKDGYMDIIAGNISNGGVKVFIADNNTGTWQCNSHGLPSIGSYYGIAIADINLDNNLDIIAGSNSNQGVKIWLGDNTTGRWHIQTNNGLPDTGNYYGIVCADFDKDGRIDIAAGNNNNEGIQIWLNKDIWRLASIGLPTSGYYHRLVAVDINLDGYTDIVATYSGGIKICISGTGDIAFLGWTGNVGYTTDGLQPEYGTAGTVFTYQINYVNIKNIPPKSGYPKLKIYANHKLAGEYQMIPVDKEDDDYTDGKLYYYSTTLGSNKYGYSYQFEAIDINNNIAIGTPVHLQYGPRVLKQDISRHEWAQISTPETSREYYSFQMTDINMDGRLDIAVATFRGLKVWIAGSTDDDNWIPADMGLPEYGMYYGVVFVDFNLDAKMDIIATKFNGIEAWLGDGNGRWERASTGLPVDGFYYGIVAGDVNLDGYPDIVAGTNDNRGIGVWLGNGKGKWQYAASGLPDNERLCSVALVDFNLDNKPDIIAGDYNGVRIWFHDNPQKHEYAGRLPIDVSFDIIGQPDVMFGRYDGIVKAWAGDGYGNWEYAFTNLVLGDE